MLASVRISKAVLMEPTLSAPTMITQNLPPPVSKCSATRSLVVSTAGAASIIAGLTESRLPGRYNHFAQLAAQRHAYPVVVRRPQVDDRDMTVLVRPGAARAAQQLLDGVQGPLCPRVRCAVDLAEARQQPVGGTDDAFLAAFRNSGPFLQFAREELGKAGVSLWHGLGSFFPVDGKEPGEGPNQQSPRPPEARNARRHAAERQQRQNEVQTYEQSCKQGRVASGGMADCSLGESMSFEDFVLRQCDSVTWSTSWPAAWQARGSISATAWTVHRTKPWRWRTSFAGARCGSAAHCCGGACRRPRGRGARAIAFARVSRRLPLAYLTREAWFAGMRFHVDKRVCIPRSPLAELIEGGFAPWLSPGGARRIIDLCTGSGCIAAACASAFPDAEVVATDLSPASLCVAERNLRRLGLTGRVELRRGDLFAGAQGEFDLIVANPPYVPAGAYASLRANTAMSREWRWRPAPDGLAIASRILEEAPRYLAEGGLLALEVGEVGRRSCRRAAATAVPLAFAGQGRGGRPPASRYGTEPRERRRLAFDEGRDALVPGFEGATHSLPGYSGGGFFSSLASRRAISRRITRRFQDHVQGAMLQQNSAR